jgi:hypothetical protein
MINLTTGIYAKLAGSALNTSIGGRLYKAYAPEGAIYPYVVFFIVTDIPEYPGGKTIEKYSIQFSLFSSASGSTEVEGILTNLRALYDDCVLTITGNTPIYFIRENFTATREEHTTVAGTIGVFHYIQEYDGWMVKT